MFSGPRSQDIWSSWDEAAEEDSLQFPRHFLAPHDSIILIVYCRGWLFQHPSSVLWPSESTWVPINNVLWMNLYSVLCHSSTSESNSEKVLLVLSSRYDSTKSHDSKKFWATWQVLLFVSEFLSAALPHTKIVSCILNLEIEVRILKTLKILFSSQHHDWDVFQLFSLFLWLRRPCFIQITDLLLIALVGVVPRVMTQWPTVVHDV